MKQEAPENVTEDMRLYYTEMLSDYPDVLSTQSAAKITGYGKTSINNWCTKKYMRCFKKNGINHIPKIYLVEFFCSPYFRSITRKSSWHIRVLKNFPRWK